MVVCLATGSLNVCLTVLESVDSLVCFSFFFSLLLSPSLSPSTGILEGSLETIKSGRVKRMIIELAPDWWRNFHVSIEHGLSILQRVLEDGQFQGTCN